MISCITYTELLKILRSGFPEENYQSALFYFIILIHSIRAPHNYHSTEWYGPIVPLFDIAADQVKIIVKDRRGRDGLGKYLFEELYGATEATDLAIFLKVCSFVFNYLYLSLDQFCQFLLNY